jgi:hypothetical protein
MTRTATSQPSGRAMTRWQRGEADVDDAARFACNALLAQQGLRATTSGGHYAVERAVRAQFGESFQDFGDLRRRRDELEYPRVPGDTPTADEAKQAVDDASRLIAGARRLIEQLAFFA